MRKAKVMQGKQIYSWVLFALAMIAICTLLTWGKPFRVVGLFAVSGIAVGSLYALGGIGLVVLFRATGILNFANGAIGAFGAMLCWQALQWGWPGSLTWALGIMATTALAVTYGGLIAPGLYWRTPVVKAVATLGFALIVLGLTAFIWEDDVRSLSMPTDKMAVTVLGLRVTVTRLIVFLSSIAIVLLIDLYLGRTRTGLHMRALANDRSLSALIGVPIVRVEITAWFISGLIAGFTGLMFATLLRLEPFVLTFLVIPSLAAAICGRLENLWLVFIGGLSMGIIESLLTMSPALKDFRPVAPFLIAGIALIWMQRGTSLALTKDE